MPANCQNGKPHSLNYACNHNTRSSSLDEYAERSSLCNLPILRPLGQEASQESLGYEKSTTPSTAFT